MVFLFGWSNLRSLLGFICDEWKGGEVDDYVESECGCLWMVWELGFVLVIFVNFVFGVYCVYDVFVGIYVFWWFFN